MKKLLLIAALLGTSAIKGMEYNGKEYSTGTCNWERIEQLQPKECYGRFKEYSRWEAKDPKSGKYVGGIKIYPREL